MLQEQFRRCRNSSAQDAKTGVVALLLANDDAEVFRAHLRCNQNTAAYGALSTKTAADLVNQLSWGKTPTIPPLLHIYVFIQRKK